MNKLHPFKIKIIVQIELVFNSFSFFCISRVIEQFSEKCSKYVGLLLIKISLLYHQKEYKTQERRSGETIKLQ